MTLIAHVSSVATDAGEILQQSFVGNHLATAIENLPQSIPYKQLQLCSFSVAWREPCLPLSHENSRIKNSSRNQTENVMLLYLFIVFDIVLVFVHFLFKCLSLTQAALEKYFGPKGDSIHKSDALSDEAE
ncbi:hypothetical protein CDAR_315861 [Caerostris darwini]|uniref:Uncharacterized protein n=1 Tax=Caerostris darwini TaxID=1538125 RepID=A0AAV4MAV8_9ARAC|nr:hypothetical protein CDAR_315861 [Caerostris darwini]